MLAERFWAKVDPDPAGGCWQWTGQITKHKGGGYGRFHLGKIDGKYRNARAHRVAYELLVGPIPEGLTLDHLCRNRACVNPGHLEPVTSVENTRRGASLANENARKTHCKHGHEFTPENTYFPPGIPWRECRECRKRASRDFKIREKERLRHE